MRKQMRCSRMKSVFFSSVGLFRTLALWPDLILAESSESHFSPKCSRAHLYNGGGGASPPPMAPMGIDRVNAKKMLNAPHLVET